MSDRGDRVAGSIIDLKFSTVDAGGAPVTLSGSPAISVYKANSTTESASGVTLTVDFDGRTGLNHVRIDTSADGTFYAAANDFDVVITAGTAGGISQVGMVVGSFSLENRNVRVDVRKWNNSTVSSFNTGDGPPSCQEILKSLYRAGGSSVVRVTAKGGNDSNDGKSSTFPFLTYAAMHAVTAARDVEVICAGAFNETTNNFQLQQDQALYGAGMFRTTIQSSASLPNSCIIGQRKGSRVEELSVQGTAASGVAQSPFGSATFDQAITGPCEVRRCRGFADTDGVYLSRLDFQTTAICSYEDVQLDTNFDCVRVLDVGTVYLKNCQMNARGPSLNGGGTDARLIAIDANAQVFVRGGMGTVSGALTNNFAVLNGSGSPSVYLQNFAMRSSGTEIKNDSGTIHDFGSVWNTKSGAGTFIHYAAGTNWANVVNESATRAMSNTTVGTATAVGTVTTLTNDPGGVTTLLGRLSAGRAANLDNLDAAITTRATVSAILSAGLSSFNTPDTVGNKLKQLTFTSANVVDATPTGGTGAFAVAVTVNDGSSPIQGAVVRYTSGATSFTGTTNASGQCTLNLDAATYTVAITRAAYQFGGATGGSGTNGANPVTGNTTATYSMSATVIAPPALPTQATGMLLTVDGQGNPQPDVVISFKMTAGPGGAVSYNQEFTLTSSSGGVLSGAFVKGATYQGWRGRQAIKRYTFTVADDADSFDLPEILGMDPVVE